jgi:hypothetical protein
MTAIPPAITFEIISPAMSVPQNPVRHTCEAGVAETATRRIEKAKRSMTMRFMVIVKADKNTEAGAMPSTEMLAAMGKFNEEMAKGGVMLAGEGLHPTSKGARNQIFGKTAQREPRPVHRDQ